MIRLAWPEAQHLHGRLWVVVDRRVVAARFGQKIVVGPLFFMLDAEERVALVMHECAHTLWQQLGRGLIRLLAPAFLPWLVRRQEFAADDHAARQGYREALVNALQKLDPEDRGSGIYPRTSVRIARLKV